jgi:membrane protein YqaA with SNARE-associated domain
MSGLTTEFMWLLIADQGMDRLFFPSNAGYVYNTMMAMDYQPWWYIILLAWLGAAAGQGVNYFFGSIIRTAIQMSWIEQRPGVIWIRQVILGRWWWLLLAMLISLPMIGGIFSLLMGLLRLSWQRALFALSAGELLHLWLF